MKCKPDVQYLLKQAELDYSIGLEKYHTICNTINNLKTIISILVSLAGVGISLLIPLLLDKNAFISFFSVGPDVYQSVIPMLSIIISMLVIGGLAIIITLFTENSSSLFDRELSIDKFSDLSILTRYRKITKKLDEISQIVSYKYDIYRKILIVLIISSVLVIGITILFLNGLGSGDRIINILLTSIVPSLTSLHTIPMFIWAIVTLGIIFHIFGFASLLFTFAGDSRCGKSEHDICSWACIISYILCATLTISIILTTINQYLVLMLIINVVLLMILPYFTSFIVIVSLYINIRKNIAEIQKLLKET